MTLRYSNSRFLEILEGDLREGIGWEVVVRSYIDYASILAHVFEWEAISWTKELSAAGTGSITLDLDSETFQVTTEPEVLLDAPNLWQFYYNGVLRHEWIAEKLDEQMLEESEARRVTVSGPGTLSILTEALVLPPNYPTVPPFYWTFTDATMASRWLAWLEAAQARGMLTQVEPQFTATTDTAGIAWTDVSSTQEPNGDNLMSRLAQIADLVQADYVMRVGFKLDMRLDYGFQRQEEVVFYPLSSQLSRGRKRDREHIRNTVVAQDAYGALSIVEDAGSVFKWRRREAWVSAGNALDNTSRDAVANAALAQLKKEAREWTLKVDEGSPYKLFYDYDLGDWIGVDVDPIQFEDPSTVESLRIVGMAASVTDDGVMDLELTLETLRQTRLKDIQDAINKLGGDTATVTAATPISVGTAAAGAIAAADIGDLSNVSGTAADQGDILVWNDSTGEWEPAVPTEGGFKGSWNPAVTYAPGSIVEHLEGIVSVHYGTVSTEAAGDEPGVAGTWVLLGGGGGGGTGAGIYTLGVDSIGGTLTEPVTNRHYAQKITVESTSMLQAVEVYCENTDGAPNSLGVGLYADIGGEPSSMIAMTPGKSGDEFYIPDDIYGAQFPAGRWLTLPLAKALAPGDYWIVFYSVDPTGFRVYKDTGAAGSSRYWTASGSWISDGYTGVTSSTDSWSMRAVLTDIKGAQGDVGDPGNIWVYTGEWDSGTTYAADDVVTLGGSSYVAIAESTNQTPPNATYWQVVATSGLAGVLFGTTPPSAPPFTGATSPLFVDTDATYDWSQYGIPGPQGPAGITPGGTTGQVLAKASDVNNDGEWIDVPAPVANMSPLWTPVGTPDWAEEFTDATLSTDWVRVDASGHDGYVTWTQAAGLLSMGRVSGTDASTELHCMLRPVVSPLVVGDAYVTATQLLGPYSTAYTMSGLVLSDGTTYGSGAQVITLDFITSSAGLNVSTRGHAGFNSGTGTWDSWVVNGGGSQLIYSRLVMTAANTWRQDVSSDGVSWRIGSASARTVAPTHVGFLTSNWGTSQRGTVTYHFLRRYSGVT